MTDDLISRSEAIKSIENVLELNNYYHPYSKSKKVPIDEVIDRLNELPSAQPERIRGRWIYTGVKFPNWDGQIVSEAICSECNGISYFRRAFDKYIGANICPNCGADMKGKHDD